MIVLPIANSTLFTLNEVATLVWEAADGRTPMSKVVDTKICKRFDITPDQAQRDVEDFVNELTQHGIPLVSERPFVRCPHRQRRRVELSHSNEPEGAGISPSHRLNPDVFTQGGSEVRFWCGLQALTIVDDSMRCSEARRFRLDLRREVGPSSLLPGTGDGSTATAIKTVTGRILHTPLIWLGHLLVRRM
jgi:coenzyme PQQ synthesis protein D (PqqD)